ncbi:MAG: polysaccharide deacetylase family protein [Clostridia bacterium]|nr:polysaccharide deacetylase family protein [Clostridia bacterium]
MKKKNNSKSRMIVILLAFIIIICSIWLINKNKQQREEKQISSQTQENTELTQDDETDKLDEISEKENKEVETKEQHLNNLAEDEASFGDLDEPTYKIGEKNLKLPILIYHGFSTPLPEGDIYKLMCTKDNFEGQILTLKDAGFTFITLEDLYKYKNGKIGLPEKTVAITMDDGWEGNYTEAFDLIKKHNVPATIFIVENLVGTQGYFTWEQAKEMYDSGLVKIHVHGRKHVSATGYSKEKLIEDYNHTHQMIEEKLGAKVQKIMAYPAGDSSTNTIKWLKEAGFEVQVQTKYGTVNKSNTLDLTGLGRVRAERASGSSILKTINTAK